jgi:hypothetical protein
VFPGLRAIRQTTGADFSKPQKEFLRDGLVGLLRAGQSVFFETAKQKGQKGDLPFWPAVPTLSALPRGRLLDLAGAAAFQHGNYLFSHVVAVRGIGLFVEG